jgi:argininosuccinate lyase
MLRHVGLLSEHEADVIESALTRIAREAESGEIVPSESLEDVHMNVESVLTERTGDIGAKLHTGRSRNDQSNTTVRLYMRKELLKIWGMMKSALDVMLDQAERHAETVIPGYTHMQQAQIITMGHFWMAHFQALRRDASLLLDAYDAVDESPLGCGALAGSTLPLDREFTARDLGFSKICENSMDAVGQRDHIIAFHYFASLFGVHMSRMSEDLIIYFTSEFGMIELPDAFCTGSSMMPQKKNPDVLEILRGKSGQLTAGLIDALCLMKGVPLTYNRDFQEDKRSLWRSIATVQDMLEVIIPFVASVEVNEERARRGFEDGFIYATDVAEYLVERGIPFRESHETVGRVVRWCMENLRSLNSLSTDEWRLFAPQIGPDLPALLTPEKSVRRRDTAGGTSPRQVRVQVERGRDRIAELDAEFTERAKLYPSL